MLLTLLVASTIAQAATPTATVYLQCATNEKGMQKDWDITLNESAGTVDYYTAISGQQRRPARFTADAVYFIGFTLSRETLTIERQVEGGAESGTCRVANVTKRAF